MFQKIKDYFRIGYLGARHSDWKRVRNEFIKDRNCAACGGNKKLEVHHILPFLLYPTLELDKNNLIVLCEGNKNINCHLVIGHRFNYKKYNQNVVEDAAKLLKNKNQT